MALQYTAAAEVLELVLAPSETAPSDTHVPVPNAREAEAEDESDLGELEYAPEETSGGLTVRAALYRVHAATQAPLSVVHALVMRTLHYMGALVHVMDAVCARGRGAHGKGGAVAAELVALCAPTARARVRLTVCAMLCDLLCGAGRISGGGHLRRVLLAHRALLEAELARLVVRAKATAPHALVPAALRALTPLPRYARVNTLRASVADVLAELQQDGYKEVSFAELVEHMCASPWSSAAIVAVDPAVCAGTLLALPPLVDLHAHRLVTRGALVLQQRASTLSGWLLAPPPHSIALDACAAPGMKTSQLAESMRDTGTLYAVDRSAPRLATLQRLAARHGMRATVPVHASFLELDPHAPPYAAVQYLLCDPSCSGSGISNRGDELVAYARLCLAPTPPPLATLLAFTPPRVSRARLHALAAFQCRVVLHALRFPRARRVVYSTCSVHWTENEEVVLRVLQDARVRATWRLAENVMPTWTRRGKRMEERSEEDRELAFMSDAETRVAAEGVDLTRCVRTQKEDHTIGFFVAVFERIEAPQPEDVPRVPEELPLETKSKTKKRRKRKAGERGEECDEPVAPKRARSDAAATPPVPAPAAPAATTTRVPQSFVFAALDSAPQ